MSYIQRHNLQKFPPDYEMAGADCDIPWHGEKSITPLFGCGDGGSNLLIKVQLQATAQRKREGLSLSPPLSDIKVGSRSFGWWRRHRN